MTTLFRSEKCSKIDFWVLILKKILSKGGGTAFP